MNLIHHHSDSPTIGIIRGVGVRRVRISGHLAQLGNHAAGALEFVVEIQFIARHFLLPECRGSARETSAKK